MRKYKSAYLKPYMRKARKQDFKESNASSLAITFSQSEYIKEEKVYVLILRGNNTIIGINSCKDNLKKCIRGIGRRKNSHRMKKINKWRNDIKKDLQK